MPRTGRLWLCKCFSAKKLTSCLDLFALRVCYYSCHCSSSFSLLWSTKTVEVTATNLLQLSVFGHFCAFYIVVDRLTELNLGEKYPRAERNMWRMFNVITSNIEIAIIPQRIARFRWNLVQSLITSQPIYYKCSRSNGQRSNAYGHRSSA